MENFKHRMRSKLQALVCIGRHLSLYNSMVFVVEESRGYQPVFVILEPFVVFDGECGGY